MSAPLRGSRREIALVATVLLLPIPLLAASGLNLPLPEVVERGIASLSPSAEDSRQTSREKPASDVSPGNTRTTKTEPAFEALTAAPVRAGTSLQGATPARVGDEDRSPETKGGQDPTVETTLGGTGDAASPGGDGAPRTSDASPSSPLLTGADEPEGGPASPDQDKPTLVRVMGGGQDVSAGASADESGNVVVSPPAESAAGGSGVEAAVSPDEGTPVTVSGPLPNPELPLP